MFLKHIKIAALILSLLMLTACAAPAGETAKKAAVQQAAAEATPEPQPGHGIDSPEKAEEAARAELIKMRELGLLAEGFSVSGEAPDYAELLSEGEGAGLWAVRWYGGRSYLNDWQGGSKYSVSVNLEPDTGRIVYFSIEANGDEDDESYEEVVTQLEYDPSTGEDKPTEFTWRYYENYGDIFSEDISIGGYCELMKEYWGCDSYRLCATEDYGYNIGAPDAGTPLKDIRELDMNYYLTVEFETDGEVKPCYIQVGQFPGRVFFNVGSSHIKG